MLGAAALGAVVIFAVRVAEFGAEDTELTAAKAPLAIAVEGGIGSMGESHMVPMPKGADALGIGSPGAASAPGWASPAMAAAASLGCALDDRFVLGGGV